MDYLIGFLKHLFRSLFWNPSPTPRYGATGFIYEFGLYFDPTDPNTKFEESISTTSKGYRANRRTDGQLLRCHIYPSTYVLGSQKP